MLNHGEQAENWFSVADVETAGKGYESHRRCFLPASVRVTLLIVAFSDEAILLTFKGNKKNLPVRYCKTCHKPMVWRKKWDKCWDDVQYCSERCRRQRHQLPDKHQL